MIFCDVFAFDTSQGFIETCHREASGSTSTPARPTKVKTKAEEKPVKKYQRISWQDLQKCFGLKIDFTQAKAKVMVNTFLTRYFARQVIKGEDYCYVCQPHEEGFQAYFMAPCWDRSQKKYWGIPQPSQIEAEANAAITFLREPDVQQAAENLPPPMQDCVAYVNSLHRRASGAEIKGRAKQLYDQLAQGCATAFNDRRA